ncbi:MAG: tetratricopeptide repeat protein [Saprospiraceae bacterium]|nr:tetratricopeptide repeat protein [Saprospiraceae bacterium]
MNKTIALLTLTCLLATGLQAQTWRKLSSTADEQLKQGNYAQAAENYEKAWQKKQKKKELIFNAGEAYYMIKDYRKAAEAYQHVKDENDKFPLVGLKYARSLKQDGQYEKAKMEFKKFIDSYAGEGKSVLEEIVQTEIKGCELGLDLPSRADRSIELSFAGANVNSEAAEFAPFPMSDDLLYFSSAQGAGHASITPRNKARAGLKPPFLLISR